MQEEQPKHLFKDNSGDYLNFIDKNGRPNSWKFYTLNEVSAEIEKPNKKAMRFGNRLLFERALQLVIETFSMNGGKVESIEYSTAVLWKLIEFVTKEDIFKKLVKMGKLSLEDLGYIGKIVDEAIHPLPVTEFKKYQRMYVEFKKGVQAAYFEYNIVANRRFSI